MSELHHTSGLARGVDVKEQFGSRSTLEQQREL